jgi:integration host factor subunit beta
MTKKDVIMAVASTNPSTSRKTIEEAVTLVFEMMAFYLGHHQRVELRGFGVFSVRRRAGHRAHNPQTGEMLWVPEKYVPFFRPSSALKESLKKALVPVKKSSFFSALTRAVRDMI